ncbi:MAG: transketolase [Ignavibacteriae bacterium]|nr:transketolase [Ignavibacteriota bacterium]
MTIDKLNELKETAFKVREHIIKMSTDGGCFIGASLSCADIIVYLYKCFLNIGKDNLSNPQRDYFFLSKGHDVPALYGTLAESGLLEKSRLNNHLNTKDFLYWHPNTNIPGVEFHSGSLGHLLSVAMGTAYDCLLCGQNNKVVVLLGDGELNEGSVWEALLVAPSLELNNLVVIVDRNKFQANIETEKLIKLEPLAEKFLLFGWKVLTTDGHSFIDMEKIFTDLKEDYNMPVIVIADTLRGKGLPSIESRADRWFCNFTNEEVYNLLEELRTQEKTILTSETLMVR